MTEAKYANETEALSRIERLQDRNDFLNSQVDELRKDLTRLLHENFALKEILIKTTVRCIHKNNYTWLIISSVEEDVSAGR